MKKQVKRPLNLQRETIQDLADKKLKNIVGGDVTSTLRHTHFDCSKPCA